MSLKASQRALVQEHIHELKSQLQLLKKDSGDYAIVIEQVRFFNSKLNDPT